MPTFAQALYAVAVVSLPTKQTYDPTPAPPFVAPANAPPRTIALSRSGALAMLHFEGSQPQLLVIRTNGTQVRVSPPPDTILAKTFHLSQIGTTIKPSFPHARFETIALANDGTPFATITSFFSGAWLGTEAAVFRWNGKRWNDSLSAVPIPSNYEKNVAIGAVDTVAHFALNDDYGAEIIQMDDDVPGAHYRENQAFSVTSLQSVALGYGDATASRGQYIVGYSDGEGLLFASELPSSMTALRWINGRRTVLGQGVAYGVNSGGDAVGANNRRPEELGEPMLWRGGHAIALSTAHGSGYAIADDGTIVGSIQNAAFIVDAGDAALRVRKIDELIREPGWHISAAYAIAANGRILAAGYRTDGIERILLLDPVQQKRSRARG